MKALVVYPSLVVSTTEELAKPPISREQMAQAVQREMHSKVLLRAAELVAMGWTRGSGARNELPARGAASCSAVTSTTSSTFPARAQRRRGVGGLTAAPVSHRQGTIYQALHACRGRPAYSP